MRRKRGEGDRSGEGEDGGRGRQRRRRLVVPAHIGSDSSPDLASASHLRSATTVAIDALARNWYLLYDLGSYLVVHLTLF